MNREEIKAEIGRLRSIIDDEDDRVRRKENAKLVGKCFRFRNSYGGSHEDWWLYKKVTALDEDGHLKLLSFERTSMNHIEIHADDFAYGVSSLGDPIKPSEFLREWNKLLKDLAGIEP